MKWAIEIIDTSLDIRNFSDLVRCLGFEIVENSEFLLIRSSSMDNFSSAKDVFLMAKKLQLAFSGPANIDKEFKFGSVVDLSSNPIGRYGFFEAPSVSVIISIKSGQISTTTSEVLSNEDLAKSENLKLEEQYQIKLKLQTLRLEAVFYNQHRAIKVLELLSVDNPSGEALYKLYEILEQHPANRNTFQNRFGVRKDDFNRFKDAVHNPSVSGDWARHAYHGVPKTSNPMTKDEAKIFVHQLAEAWLELARDEQ